MKTTKKLIALLLVTLTALSMFVSCGNQEESGNTPTEQEFVKTPLEVKESDLRKMALDYMYSMSAIEWTPTETFNLEEINKGLIFTKGVKYRGMPYTTKVAADLETFKSNLDENNNYIGSSDFDKITGNHCTSSIIKSWKRVSNSVSATYTGNMLPTSKTGILPVGEYKYEAADDITETIIKRNTSEVIYAAYAELKPADAVITAWKEPTRTGHARMIKEVNVVKSATGKINPAKSTVTTIEQTSSFDKQEKTAKTTWYVDHTYTFNELYTALYIPITCSELNIGETASPETTITSPNSSRNMRKGTLEGVIASNFAISSIEIKMIDSNGNVAADGVITTPDNLFVADEKNPGVRKLTLRDIKGAEVNALTEALSKLPDGRYQYVISVEYRYGAKQDIHAFYLNLDPALE